MARYSATRWTCSFAAWGSTRTIARADARTTRSRITSSILARPRRASRCMSRPRCSPWTTSGCTCSSGCIGVATTSSSPRRSRCICMSTRRPPRPHPRIQRSAPSSSRFAAIIPACRNRPKPDARSGTKNTSPAMPKIVDHAQRRDEIAHVACQVVAHYGFEQATVARIARAAGYTTGMVAHYYDSKQDIILAALRLILLRIEVRLTRERKSSDANLLEVLSEALAIDAQRFTECAFWMAFWGQVSADKKLKRLNAWVHREYMRLFARCFAGHWQEWDAWPQAVRDQVLRSVVTFINGLTAGAVTSPRDWPAAVQLKQLDLQLELLRRWAKSQRADASQARAK